MTSTWAIWQRYYNSLPGRAPMKQMSHTRITIPDDELPPAKKVRRDSEFCESGSVSIHANDDNHHTLDGEKKLCQKREATTCTYCKQILGQKVNPRITKTDHRQTQTICKLQ